MYYFVALPCWPVGLSTKSDTFFLRHYSEVESFILNVNVALRIAAGIRYILSLTIHD